MKQFLLLFLLLSGAICFSPAQEVKNVSAEFDNELGVILIYFDLNGVNQKVEERFTVRAYYSLDSGKIYEQITEATGDVGDGILKGTGKLIQWDYFIENPEFNGQNVMFKVEAKWSKEYEIRRLEGLGKPNSALNSLLVPGWGHAKVHGKRGYWWTTALVYGVAGTGLYLTLSGNQKYKDYQNADTGEQALSLLDQANNQKKLGVALLSAGGALWLSNVIWVALKGRQNQQKLLRLTQDDVAFAPLQLHYDAYTRSTGFKLNFRF